MNGHVPWKCIEEKFFYRRNFLSGKGIFLGLKFEPAIMDSAFPMSLMRVRAQDHTMRRVAFRKDDWKEQENETMLSCNTCYTSVIIIIIIIIFFKEWYNILAKIKLKIWHEIRGVLWNKILKVTFISFFSIVQLIKLHFCIHEFHGKMATLNWLSFLLPKIFSLPQSITLASFLAH
jgi:hypothetical protein